MELKCLHPVWLATSDPVSSDVDTGPSDGEGNEDEDVGYGVAQRPAIPMDVDLAVPEGKPSGERDRQGVAGCVRDTSRFSSCAGGCHLSGFSHIWGQF